VNICIFVGVGIHGVAVLGLSHALFWKIWCPRSSFVMTARTVVKLCELLSEHSSGNSMWLCTQAVVTTCQTWILLSHEIFPCQGMDCPLNKLIRRGKAMKHEHHITHTPLACSCLCMYLWWVLMIGICNSELVIHTFLDWCVCFSRVKRGKFEGTW